MTKLRGGAPAPSSPFALLPLRSGVVFPGTTLGLSVGRPRSLALLGTLHEGDIIGVATQRDPRIDAPTLEDLYPVGSFAKVVGISRRNEKVYQLVLEGLDRFSLDAVDDRAPFWRADGVLLAEIGNTGDAASILAEELHTHLEELTQKGGALGEIPSPEGDPSSFADRIAASLGLDTEDAIAVLSELDVAERLKGVIELLTRARTRAELRTKIEQDVRKSLGKTQKEAILREQLKAIKRELGDDEEEDETDNLRARLDAAGLSPEARKIADRELKRLDQTGGQGPEANVIRSYLDWLASLPWSRRAESTIEINAISDKLEADHYGMEDVKKRILEHMAVQQLSGNPRGTILCLVGPPGVGKTSLGRSIAEATKRPFVRIALGGVRDEAEIRGHRRTYVGAIPGRIAFGLKQAEVKNPVVLLDEIDKLGHGYGGSPEAALLEVLDPEQNKHFTDHYLETPFDLSEVMFVCTANSLDTISAPLRDRLEIVELSGYTQAEKSHIARRHLIPKRMKEVGIPEGSFSLTDAALESIVEDYTREAGVRQLDRELTRLGRSLALEVARNKDVEHRFVVDRDDVSGYLGKPRFRSDVAERVAYPGVATGMAWTPFGGDILFIETSRMPGKGRLEITGQLGDVMKESARAALTYVRSHAPELGLDSSALDTQDLHIHVPAGAVPKDGPSAGVTIFTALASLLSGRKVRPDTAMTGECSLRGRVLPVGGIKAKVLAAHRAGIRRVILPKQNERDLADVPEVTREALEIHLVEDMSEVLSLALETEHTDPVVGGSGVDSNSDSLLA
ncbi:MAG: endopeptidase La [Polyangiaceae bacterium]